MNAFKNLTHAVFLALWAVAGLIFTLKFLSLGLLVPVLGFWAWFAGYAAFTSFVQSQVKHVLWALATHAGTLFVLGLLPSTMPFSLVRFGLDCFR